MPKFSSLVDRIAGEGSAAWNIHFRAKQDHADGKDVIIMSVGDPDFPTPAPIIEAAVMALRSGDTHYSEIVGRKKLREAIAAETMRVSGSSDYQVSHENVMVMAGTQNALFGAAQLLLEKGDEIIALDPMYVTYEGTWRSIDADIVRVATPRETNFRPDIAAIEAAITDKTKAIVYANPNNPTGVVLTLAELQAIADLAIKHDLWVIADEVYAAQTFEKPHFSIAALPGMAERTVTCSSLSKSQAMTGWRIGWMVAPVDMIYHCENLGLIMLYGVPGFIQEAAIEALTSSRSEIGRMLEIYRKRRNLTVRMLGQEEKVKVLTPEAGMFVLLDVADTGLTANAFSQMLYEAEGVSSLDGSAFGEPAGTCIRLSFTTGEDEIEEGCKRIKRFLKTL
ncbi:MAG: aminotransferase class I/II-fold pyridoxal phosphate-dependent enzyme [Salaquimonas sp.]